MSVADAALWATASSDYQPSSVAHLAQQYLDVGFHADEAIPWWAHWIMPSPAALCANEGWAADQVAGLYDTLSQTGTCAPAGARAWILSGITPRRCLLYARIGCALDGALVLEARRAEGEDIDAGVSILEALRSAWE